MAVNDDLFDIFVRHQIFLERYKSGTVAKIKPLLRKVEKDIADRISRLPENPSRARLQSLLDQIRDINRQMSVQITKDIRKQLIEFAENEAQFTKNAVNAVLPAPLNITLAVPTAEILRDVVMAEPFQGRVLKEWAQSIGESNYKRVRDQLNIGLVEGESIPQVVKRFEDVVKYQTRNELEAIIRTAISHTTSGARRELFAANSDVIAKEQWRSTLDGRTSAICRSRDGKMWDIGESHPYPPAHINCRSIIVPVIKSFAELGLKGVKLPEATRASMNGQVAADTTYAEWFKRQSVSFQNDVLGPTRGKLYRSGGLKMDTFSDTTGRMYNLDELRAKHPAAFKKAGL